MIILYPERGSAKNKNLDEKGEYLHTIVSNMPAVLWAMDCEGVFTLSEGKSLEALGLKPGELVGRSIFDVYRNVPEVLENFRCALSGEASKSIVEVNGLVLESWYNPIKDQNGKVTGVISIGIQSPEHKELEDALLEREKKLRCLYGFSKMLKASGMTLEGILRGMTFLIPAAWQYPDIACVKVSFDGQEAKTPNFKETSWKLSAHIKMAEVKRGAIDVYYLEEKPERDYGPFLKEEKFLLDDLAEKLSEVFEKLQNESQLRQFLKLFTDSTDPIVFEDLSGKIIDLNPEAERFYGWTRQELLGKPAKILCLLSVMSRSMSC
ncbi:MAG: PAS domain S-box protein [Candidatus Bathyarchaeota archaeon]